MALFEEVLSPLPSLRRWSRSSSSANKACLFRNISRSQKWDAAWRSIGARRLALRSSRPSFMKCSAAIIRSIALRSNSASAKCRRREVAHGIRNSASTAQLRTKLSRGRDYLDSCHYTAPRFQRGSRSRGHEADNRRGRNCSTARQCARNRVARIGNYRVLMRIGKVARSKVVRTTFKRSYIGVSRTTSSTLASSTVSLDKCSSAAACAFVI